MKKYLVRIYRWENPRLAFSDNDFAEGEAVIVEGDFGSIVGKIEAKDIESKEETGEKIIRKATARDLEAAKKNEAKKEEILTTSKSEARRLELGMKLIDAQVNLDGSSVVIVFTAEGRVDFRELVKNLARIFHRSVRMFQIGSRDEARRLGGCGVCGRELCCVKFPGNLPSISTEMARVQKVAHRGSERISGLCGRLLCCLAYEAEQYREMMEGMPELGSSAKTPKGKGVVRDINLIKQEITVQLENGDRVIIKKEELN